MSPSSVTLKITGERASTMLTNAGYWTALIKHCSSHVNTLQLQVTESFFFRNGDFSLFHTLFLGLDFFSMASTASFSFLRISRTRAWNTSSM